MAEPVRVRIEPLGALIEVAADETLIEAAWRAGLVWPTVCYGQAACLLCRVRVIAGGDAVAPADEVELEALRRGLPRSQATGDERLACRLRPSAAPDGPVVADAEVVVYKRGVRRERSP